jgi:hypothetical protein
LSCFNYDITGLGGSITMSNMQIDAATQLNKTDKVTIDVNEAGELYAKTATGGTLGKPGIVKPDGSTVKILADGTISAVQSTYSLPIATTSTLGGVKSDGSTINITNAGVISAVGGGSGGGIPWLGSTRTTLTFPGSGSTTNYAATQNCWLNCSCAGGPIYFRAYLVSSTGTTIGGVTAINRTEELTGILLPVKSGQSVNLYANYSGSITNKDCRWVFPDTATGSGAGASIEAMTQAHRPYKLSDIPSWITFKNDLEYAIEHFFNVAAITIEVLLNDMVGGEKREAMGLTVDELRDMQQRMGISI